MVAHLRHVDGSYATRMHDVLALAPGQVAGLAGIPGSGLTSIGLSLIAPYSSSTPVVYLDTRGWVNPAAAWEMGIPPDRFIIARNDDVTTWGRLVAVLIDGAGGVYAEIPAGVKEATVRTLAARARTRRTPLVFRPLIGKLPVGIAHLVIEARGVGWEGTERGHGVLLRRSILLDASGKAVGGKERTVEVTRDGTNDLRVVSDLGIATSRHFA